MTGDMPSRDPEVQCDQTPPQYQTQSWCAPPKHEGETCDKGGCFLHARRNRAAGVLLVAAGLFVLGILVMVVVPLGAFLW